MEIIAPFVPVSGLFRTLLPAVVGSLALLCLAACATSRRPLTSMPGQYIELRSSPGVSTVHFPRGLYVLKSEDDSGFYYAAPGGVVKHSFAGLQRYDGGLFVDRRNPQGLRGYIIWAAGVTKIGDLSREPHTFRE